MKNNFLLNLLLGMAILGTCLFLVTALGCNDAKRDNNMPDGNSYSSAVKGDQRTQTPDPTDPQHTGAVRDHAQSTGNQPTRHSGTIPPADTLPEGNKPPK
jgi:hypothetical protein